MCDDVSVGDGSCGDWCRYGGGDESEVVVRHGTGEQVLGWHVANPGVLFNKDTDITLAICLARCSLPSLIRCKWSV